MGAYSRNPHTASTSLLVQRLTVSEIEIINVPRQSKAHHHHPLNEKNGQFLAISKANNEPSPCTGQALAQPFTKSSRTPGVSILSFPFHSLKARLANDF